MSNHTPGPWRVHEGGTRPTISVGPDDAFEPFGGCGCCGSPWINGATQEERMANARLIAASPRLLEAAKAIDKLLPICGLAEYREAIELRAAIAGAEGTNDA